MKSTEFIFERYNRVVDEAPLPPDWEPSMFKQGKSTFKERLAYALERAKKLGTGSSRVAMIIEYEGRPTALKVAKNNKGLAQNEVEASVLNDGYAKQMGILIPLIDYDKENPKPLWVQTEVAQKATERQLCDLMKCVSLNQLVNIAQSILGKVGIFSHSVADYQRWMRESGVSEEDIETCMEYAQSLAELQDYYDIKLGDFIRKANWGIYQGRPVIIDIGFSSSVAKKYYNR